MSRARGFILQATYRVRSAADGRRSPVVHLYGRLDTGAAFLVRDDRQRPHFDVREADLSRAAVLKSLPLTQPVDKRTFAGEPVCRIDVDVPSDVPPLRDKLHAAGIETFEADVRFASRYLIERGIKGGCEIEGDSTPGAGGLVFENPHLHPADVQISPRVLSFDIETDAKAERLLAISLYGLGADEVLIVDDGDRPMPDRAQRCASEAAALETFAAPGSVARSGRAHRLESHRFRSHRARAHRDPRGLPARARPRPGAHADPQGRGYFGSGQASIPGRLVLDGIDLLRGAFIRMDDYSLDAVAREVLGEGKAVTAPARDRLAEISTTTSTICRPSRSMPVRMRALPQG